MVSASSWGGIQLLKFNPISRFLPGPERFRLSSRIIFDYLVGGISDILSRTIIFLQLPMTSASGKLLLKNSKILWIFAPGIYKSTDHHHQPQRLRYFPQANGQMELGRIGILILVHNITKTLLVIIQYLAVVFAAVPRTLQSNHQKIKSIAFFQNLLIFPGIPEPASATCSPSLHSG